MLKVGVDQVGYDPRDFNGLNAPELWFLIPNTGPPSQRAFAANKKQYAYHF